MRLNTILAGLVGLVVASSPAFAQFPDKPIKIMAPYAPGGNIDVTSRIIADRLKDVLGVTVLVENKAGASGMIGSDIVARAAPDGYTLLVSANSLVAVPAIYGNAPYDWRTAFTPISHIQRVPAVLLVTPSSPIKTLADFIALGRDGKVPVADSGIGTTNHLAGELFQLDIGTKFIHVPYKGAAPAVVDVMGGQVDMLFDQLSASSNFIKSGKLRALVVAGEKRNAVIPDVPTMIESGLKNSDAGTFTALMGPAGLPREVIAKLNTAVNKTLAMSTTRDRFTSVGADVLGGTPAKLDANLKQELAMWTRVAKAANIKLD